MKTVDTNKQIAKLNLVLTQLRCGKIVQNRQLRTVLGTEAYACLEDEWLLQKELREDLKNKPAQVLEYEKRLKAATFTYSKADCFSGKGKHKTARKLFGQADTQFERIVEFLEENIAPNSSLWPWFDRDINYDASNTPISCAEDFPCVVTSSSNRKLGGGFTQIKRSKREIKIEAVERAIENLQQSHVDEAAIAKRSMMAKKLRRR